MPLSPNPEVIVFNLKERYTGVSATVNALVPLQMAQWQLGYCGTTLSNGVQGMTLREAIRISRRPPPGRAFRIWHVRRDHEMMAGLWARDMLRLPIRLVFTSAAQHRHGWFPRWLISRMNAVISTTDKAASFVPNTTAVVAHGIDLTRFSPPPDKLAAWADSGLPGRYGIGVFGRVRPDKGTDVFVEAMIAALPRLPDASAKEMEEVLRLWGFPFTNRTFRVLEDLCIKSKDEALALYKRGHLYPGSVWSFGWKSYEEICEWLEVQPLDRKPKRGICCIHCGKPT